MSDSKDVWTASGLDARRQLSAISCPSTTFCAAGDAQGNVILLSPPAPTTDQLTWGSLGGQSQVLAGASHDYLYGPSGEPVEQIASSTAQYLTYTPSDSSWLVTNSAGNEVAYDLYDAYSTPSSRTTVASARPISSPTRRPSGCRALPRRRRARAGRASRGCGSRRSASTPSSRPLFLLGAAPFEGRLTCSFSVAEGLNRP